MPYNHAYVFAFTMVDECDEGCDHTGKEWRDAIQAQLDSMSDEEVRQHMMGDAPFDTYEVKEEG